MKISNCSIQDFLHEKGIRCLYHFTDRANLLSIIKHEGLLSWKDCEAQGIRIVRPGGDSLGKSLDTAKGLEHYARLSFCRQHPMMFAAKHDGRIVDPVIIEIDTKVCELQDTLFSDINATATNVRLGKGIDGLSLVDFGIVTQNYSASFTDEDKAKYQAEILVEHKIPVKYFLNYQDLKLLLTKKEKEELEAHWGKELNNLEKQLQSPIILSFEQSIINYEDQKVKIHWSANNYTKVKINNREISLDNHDIELEAGLRQCNLSILNELHIVNIFKEQNKVLCKEVCRTINIQQIKTPIIHLTSDKTLIKRGKDNKVVVNWNIKNATSAKMRVGDKLIPLNSMSGSQVLTLSETTPICIDVCGLDNVRIFSSNIVNVVAKYESIINSFCSDKLFSIIDVPFKISWNVSHANHIYIKSDKNIILDNDLAPNGFNYYTLSDRVFLTLCAEDDFGIKEKTIELGIMPKPHVQLVSIPVPEIDHRTNIKVVTNIISLGVRFPKVIDVKTPMFASTKLTTNSIKNKSLSVGKNFLIRILNNTIITKKHMKWGFIFNPIVDIAKRILKPYKYGRTN